MIFWNEGMNPLAKSQFSEEGRAGVLILRKRREVWKGIPKDPRHNLEICGTTFPGNFVIRKNWLIHEKCAKWCLRGGRSLMSAYGFRDGHGIAWKSSYPIQVEPYPSQAIHVELRSEFLDSMQETAYHWQALFFSETNRKLYV